MAQITTQQTYPTATLAFNLGATSASGETTILDKVPCLGLKNIGITIVNLTGATSACALYGSCDGVTYIAVSGFSTFGVSTAAIGHAEANGNFVYFRLTTTGVATLNAYLTAA